MESSLYSERFTIATVAGGGLGAVYLGGMANKTNWKIPFYNSMPGYCTSVIMAKVPGAVHFRG